MFPSLCEGGAFHMYLKFIRMADVDENKGKEFRISDRYSWVRTILRMCESPWVCVLKRDQQIILN